MVLALYSRVREGVPEMAFELKGQYKTGMLGKVLSKEHGQGRALITDKPEAQKQLA